MGKSDGYAATDEYYRSENSSRRNDRCPASGRCSG